MSDILRQLLANPLYAGMGGQPQQSPMSGMKLADALDMFGKMGKPDPAVAAANMDPQANLSGFAQNAGPMGPSDMARLGMVPGMVR